MRKNNQAQGDRTPAPKKIKIPARKVLVWKSGFSTGPQTVSDALRATRIGALAGAV